MNVLSVFDGMSCGQQALEHAQSKPMDIGVCYGYAVFLIFKIQNK